eukprot:TRINITY_DN12557_c0_g2_i4.p1 TRINITY_DN12557_c0_g2~~TRINITY_DN12557_c0_g2_i4.p1  ORF type:complete len:369 (+),score=59.62 TRINITY_DN12557_c0_g2_i4:208-1314(+)
MAGSSLFVLFMSFASVLSLPSFVENGQLYIRNGTAAQPMFMLGVYIHTVNRTDVDYLATAGYNTMVSYDYYRQPYANITWWLDSIAPRGMQAVISVKYLCNDFDAYRDNLIGIVSTFANHEALLGWYIDDEDNADRIPNASLCKNLINQLDPNHVVLTVLDSKDTLNLYTATSDVFGLDHYPWLNSHDTGDILSEVELAQYLVANFTAFPNITTLAVAQTDNRAVFYPGDGGTDPPANVMLAMSVLYVVAGCRNLWHYNYYMQFLSRFNPPEPAESSVVAARLTAVKEATQALRKLLPWFTMGPANVKISTNASEDRPIYSALYNDSHARMLIAVNPMNTSTIVTIDSVGRKQTVAFDPWDVVSLDWN